MFFLSVEILSSLGFYSSTGFGLLLQVTWEMTNLELFEHVYLSLGFVSVGHKPRIKTCKSNS